MSGCLGAALAALVDGELDHAGRERVHRHLAHCDACRDEVEAQRRTKIVLRTASAPTPSDALRARLLGLGASLPVGAGPGPDPLGGPVPAPAGGGLAPPRGPAAAGAPSARRRAGRAPAWSRRRPGSAGAPTAVGPGVSDRARRASAGSAFALLGVTAALALGAPPQRPASAPVQPASAAFGAEASTGVRVPSASHLCRAPVMPFVPGIRTSLPTSASTTIGVPATGARGPRS